MTQAAKLAIIFTALNAADAALTAWAVSKGYTEANPLMRSLLSFGPWGFIAVKTAIGAGLALFMWRRHPESAVLWIGPGLVAGALIWNVGLLLFR